jgi:mono/diheme cytochrome c family protein
MSGGVVMSIARWLCFCLLFCTLPAAAQAAEPAAPAAGRQAYLRYCALCHGVDLRGRDAGWEPDSPYVPPLGASGKAWRLSDADIDGIMQGGSHAAAMRLSNAAMPAFAGRLTSEEAAALLGYLKTQWSGGERAFQAEVNRRATMPVAAEAALGAQLYAVKCALCHGGELEGQTQLVGAAGQQRELRIPALRHDIFAQAMSDARLRDLIQHGEGHHPLPRFEYRMPDFRLDDHDVAALVAYLRQVWRGGPLR